jgi:anti-sigma B factor antagonist
MITNRTTSGQTPVHVNAQTNVHTKAGSAIRHRPARTIISLHGEVDIATAPVLRERLLSALRPGLRLLIVDLSGVSFCDAAGLAVLAGMQRRAGALGITLRLAAPRPQVTKLLCITGLDRYLVLHPTLSDALASAPDGAGDTGQLLTTR